MRDSPRARSATDKALLEGKSPYTTEVRQHGYTDQRDFLMAKKLGIVPPTKSNPDMERGNNEENECIELFATLSGLEPYPTNLGVIQHPDGYYGASPDGVMRWLKVLVEAKSRRTEPKTHGRKGHKEYIVEGPHYMQIQQQLATVHADGIDTCFYLQYVSPKREAGSMETRAKLCVHEVRFNRAAFDVYLKELVIPFMRLFREFKDHMERTGKQPSVHGAVARVLHSSAGPGASHRTAPRATAVRPSSAVGAQGRFVQLPPMQEQVEQARAHMDTYMDALAGMGMAVDVPVTSAGRNRGGSASTAQRPPAAQPLVQSASRTLQRPTYRPPQQQQQQQQQQQPAPMSRVDMLLGALAREVGATQSPASSAYAMAAHHTQLHATTGRAAQPLSSPVPGVTPSAYCRDIANMVSKVNAVSVNEESVQRPRTAQTTPRKRKTAAASSGAIALPGSEFGGGPALLINVFSGQARKAQVRKRTPATKKTKKANKA